jgi:aromatic ring-opening dioxygenase catalytic subunit (LigB family)
LASRTADLIAGAGFDVTLDGERGFDHGTFVPAHVMYPEADVPIYQVSMLESYDPEAHLRIGRALAPLRDEGVLIVGSGLSYHNLRLFGPGAQEPSEAFDAWLNAALAKAPADRTAAVLDWESAPKARTCHAREDHLVPLFVALGAAEAEAATQVYHQEMIFGGVTASSWRFG